MSYCVLKSNLFNSVNWESVKIAQLQLLTVVNNFYNIVTYIKWFFL